MRNRSRALTLIIGLFSFAACDYNDLSRCVYISTYPEDRIAAVSFTFDDNYQSCFSRVAPMFENYGYKATFFVIPNQVKETQWTDWKKLSDKGFEIGNHSLNHLRLIDLKESNQLEKEINEAYYIIESKIGKRPFSFAHPGHATNESVDRVVFQKHRATRVTPVGFCNWWGVVTGSTEEMLAKNVRDALNDHQWLVIAAHGVEEGWEPITSSFLEKCLKKVGSERQRIWVDHFGNLAKYKIERQNTSIISSESNGRLNIFLESSLDTSVFNYPLTIVIDCPQYKKSPITPIAGTTIADSKYIGDKLLLKVLPKSKIQIGKL